MALLRAFREKRAVTAVAVKQELNFIFYFSCARFVKSAQLPQLR